MEAVLRGGVGGYQTVNANIDNRGNKWAFLQAKERYYLLPGNIQRVMKILIEKVEQTMYGEN